MQLWALFWHINQIDKNPIALGGIGVARILPVIIFSLIGGALADSVDRRKVMFATQSVAAVLALTLALFTQFGQVTIWHIYIITALQAVVVAFDGPSRQALIPNLLKVLFTFLRKPTLVPCSPMKTKSALGRRCSRRAHVFSGNEPMRNARTGQAKVTRALVRHGGWPGSEASAGGVQLHCPPGKRTMSSA